MRKFQYWLETITAVFLLLTCLFAMLARQAGSETVSFFFAWCFSTLACLVWGIGIFRKDRACGWLSIGCVLFQLGLYGYEMRQKWAYEAEALKSYAAFHSAMEAQDMKAAYQWMEPRFREKHDLDSFQKWFSDYETHLYAVGPGSNASASKTTAWVMPRLETNGYGGYVFELEYISSCWYLTGQKSFMGIDKW